MVSVIRRIQLWVACTDSLVGNLAVRGAGDFFMFLFYAQGNCSLLNAGRFSGHYSSMVLP